MVVERHRRDAQARGQPAHGHGLDAAIERTDPWDEGEISDTRVLGLGADTALLSPRWRSRRGDVTYTTPMSSVYVRRDGEWRVVLHQQTPDPS